LSEEGLNYTIRFIPDTTAIDKAIGEISTRVSKEITEGVTKAKEEAGAIGAEAGIGGAEGIMEQFRSIKDKITDTLREFNILGGRSRSLQHPSSATVGSITQLAAQKMKAGDVSQLSKDQLLQVILGTVVAGGRALSAKEVTGLPANEAIEQSMQDQIGSLKGIAEGMFGFKEFKSMKGLANMTRLADFYERSSEATGKGRMKEIEQGLMESVGHDIIQDAMKQVMQQEMGTADWEETQLKHWQFAKHFGMDEDTAKELYGTRKEIADVVRKVGDVYQIGEAKTVGEVTTGTPKLVRDMMFIQDVFKRLGITDTKVVAKMYAGATRGAPERDIKDFESGEQIEAGYEEIGEPVKNAIIRSFQKELPDMQRELETLLLDTTPGAAKAHVEQLLFMIESALSVLEPHSLPDFWVRIGMPHWISESAISYVNTLKEELEPEMKAMMGDEVITGVTLPETGAGSPSGEPRQSSLLIIMDQKLDTIIDNLPSKSIDGQSGMKGSMRDYITG
jgi:hypothetical protein